MEKATVNEITCPTCGKKISGNVVVDSAANGGGTGADFFICECGRRISYWAASAQLADQKKLGARIKNWFRNLGKARA